MKKISTPIALVLGSALAAGAAITTANASSDNPFSVKALETGYQVAMSGKDKKTDGKKKDGNCGGNKAKSGNCGGKKAKTGACGGMKTKSGNCGGKK